MADNRWAVVVGCNYGNSPVEDREKLRGCINDAKAMRRLLIELLGFHRSHIELLKDEPGSQILSTGANIKQALDKMSDKAKPGDILFFYFSGHGTLDEDSGEQGIVGCDLNVITKYEFRQLVNRLPRGASFHMVSDSCNSGGLIDKETLQIGPRSPYTWTPQTGPLPHNARAKTISFEKIIEHLGASTGIGTSDVNALMRHAFGDDASLSFRRSEQQLSSDRQLEPDRGVLLSGCQSNEISLDRPFDGKYHGAFTHALIRAVRSKKSDYWCSNRAIVTSVRTVLEDMEKHDNNPRPQHPCLYSSDANADAGFAGTIERECWKWDPNSKTR
ncbi:metacaspase-9-like [Rhododendron vialii]|uniref:metacaspase-9-like n=1 Tax=Rhododendron vialii TaxID=182163 RepID=UPI00265F1F4F|nr:metacaspase-9-like [Rhododendron vialii]